MTNNRFIDLLRQYGRIARRKRRSYSEAVHKIVDLRQVQIDEDMPDGEKKDVALRGAEQLAVREYGKYDETFSFGGTD